MIILPCKQVALLDVYIITLRFKARHLNLQLFLCIVSRQMEAESIGKFSIWISILLPVFNITIIIIIIIITIIIIIIIIIIITIIVCKCILS